MICTQPLHFGLRKDAFRATFEFELNEKLHSYAASVREFKLSEKLHFYAVFRVTLKFRLSEELPVRMVLSFLPKALAF